MNEDPKKRVKDRSSAVRDMLKVQGLEGGKLPPQALDLEEAVLGALMLDATAVNQAIDILRPESFYKEAHQKIFAAIAKLFQQAQPIDILTVTNGLKTEGNLDFVGGPFYISRLTTRIASAANIQTHARIISQKFIQRELIRISAEITRDAFEDTTDVFDLLDKAESELFKVAEGNLRKHYESMSSLIHIALENIDAARQNRDGISGIPSGFTALDRVDRKSVV